MSLAAMNWARQQTTGSPTRKAVLMAVADYADENGLAWPSQQRIAEDTEMTDRTVRTALADLVGLGLVVRRSKRNPDGTRHTDRLQLVMTDDLRKEFPPDANRKTLPHAPPENDGRTTGKSRQNHRKLLPKPPEAVSREPTIDPPENPQKNRSDAIASVAVAGDVDMTDADRLWFEGKLLLGEAGMSPKLAGQMIGLWRSRHRDDARILWAIRESRRIGSDHPQSLVPKLLGPPPSPAVRSQGRRSSMLEIISKDYGPLQ